MLGKYLLNDRAINVNLSAEKKEKWVVTQRIINDSQHEEDESQLAEIYPHWQGKDNINKKGNNIKEVSNIY